MNYQNQIKKYEVINTKRLELMPLSLEQLKLMRKSIKQLELELNVTYKGEALEGFILEYLDHQIRIITETPQSCMYTAFWLITRKSDRVVVGSASFKGMPDEKGEIEIGYGLAKEFEHNGYMAEAVGKMCEWGLSQVGVKHIIAETDVDGYGSQRVLERNGFSRYGFGESSWYRL